MNESVLDKPIVIKLNRLWQMIGWTTPREAFIAMCGGIDGGTPPAKGMSITTDENGELIEGFPVEWSQWCKLPIRECDFSINTGRMLIRVPSVVMCPEYEGMPKKKIALTGRSLRERDGGRCQVSGRALKPDEGNMGHIVARAKGGRRTWENLVYMDKRLNSIQGTKTPEEMGWTLLREPVSPIPVPASFLVKGAKSPDHVPFTKE